MPVCLLQCDVGVSRSSHIGLRVGVLLSIVVVVDNGKVFPL